MLRTRNRFVVWLVIATVAVGGAVLAMILVHVVMGGSIGLGL